MIIDLVTQSGDDILRFESDVVPSLGDTISYPERDESPWVVLAVPDYWIRDANPVLLGVQAVPLK